MEIALIGVLTTLLSEFPRLIQFLLWKMVRKAIKKGGSRMKTLVKIAGAVVGLSLFAGAAHAVPITDVQDYADQTASTYWVDVDANKYNSPYYRDGDEDWGWTHAAITGGFTSATLEVSAFDVDTPREVDNISLFVGGVWVNLGTLTGLNNTWAFTTFNLAVDAALIAAVNAGLQVMMDIDAGTDTGWVVTLAKATLSIDGGSGGSCSPVPGQPCPGGGGSVPEPAPLALFGLGLVALVITRRRMRRV